MAVTFIVIVQTRFQLYLLEMKSTADRFDLGSTLENWCTNSNLVNPATRISQAVDLFAVTIGIDCSDTTTAVTAINQLNIGAVIIIPTDLAISFVSFVINPVIFDQ